MLVLLLVGLAVSQPFLCAAVCYNDEMRSEFACFDLWPPYTNTAFHSPASPSEQNIQFQLYTSNNPTQYQTLKANQHNTLTSSNFNPQLETKFIVHGFTSSNVTDWIPSMVRELLHYYTYHHQGVNVIVVDWSQGAKGPNYLQATANTRVVGAQIASLILTAEELGGDASKFHVIGHSLGAQIGGYAGFFLNGRLGRISGLDPAAPMFEGYDPRVKLERSDAGFVDVMHTDAVPLHDGGLGTVDLIGHVDFFPNGGSDMPGCPSDKFSLTGLLTGQIDALTDDISCSHNRAPWYYVASINDNVFQSYPCASADAVCHFCGTGCTSMGLHATDDFHGLFVSATNANYPY